MPISHWPSILDIEFKMNAGRPLDGYQPAENMQGIRAHQGKSHLRWDVKRPGFEIVRPKSGESWKMKIRNWLGTRPGKRLQKANWENHHL